MQFNFGEEEVAADGWKRLEAVVEERTEAASHILSTQLTLDKIDSDILRTSRPPGTYPTYLSEYGTGRYILLVFSWFARNGTYEVL